MPRGATFDQKRARALYDSGASCNAIARTLGVSPSTISRWAKREGLKFDRAQTSMATRAHTVDLAEARLELAQLMMVTAREGLLELGGPITVYNFGGRDNSFNSHTFDTPPLDARRQAVTTAGIAFDKASRIVEQAPDGDVSAEVRAAITGFAAGLDHLFPDDSYGQVTDAGDDDPGSGSESRP